MRNNETIVKQNLQGTAGPNPNIKPTLYSNQTVPISRLLFEIISLLKSEGKPLSNNEIIRKKAIDVMGTPELLKVVTQNDRIIIVGDTFEFKPTFKIKTKQDFLKLLKDHRGVMAMEVKELLLVPEGVEVETKPFFKNYFGVPNYSLVINEEKCKTNLIDDKINDLKSNDVKELNIGKKIDINEILPPKSEKKVDTSKKEKDNNNIDSIEYEYEYNYDYDYNSNSNNNYYKGQTNANTTQNSKRYNNRSSKSGYYPKYDTKYSNKNEYNYEEDYYNTTKTNDYDYYNYNTGGKGKKKYK